MGLAGVSVSKESCSVQETQETQVRSLGWEDPLEEKMATYSSILAWEMPWTEKPGRLVHGVTESDMTEHSCRHRPWDVMYMINIINTAAC